MELTPEIIRQKLSNPLPGINSHLKLAPAKRLAEIEKYLSEKNDAKKSAVLILLFHENGKLKIIFIRRSFYVGIHAGQIAFPGGRYDENDGNVKVTALREIEEEIGISRENIEILGQLTDIYVPPSNFIISIFVGYLQKHPGYKIDEREVAEVIELNLQDFFNEKIIDEKDFHVPSANQSVRALYYKIGNADIWGATAMVMTEFIDVLKTENRD